MLIASIDWLDPYSIWAAVRSGGVLWGVVGIFAVGAALINVIAVYAGLSTLIERKVAAHMQARVGPYRVGPHGILQWLADALKLMIKEDIIATDTDRFLFKLSPYVVFAGSFACWVALPFAPGWAPASFNIGILYLLAVSSSVVIGILMAGWASGSKWALFGAMRSAAQIVSYEVPIGLTLLSMLLVYGTLDMQQICAAQEKGFLWGFAKDVNGGLWSWGINRFPPFTALAFLIYYIAALAETNRTPFDIPEAESELVAGYHTEYSGMRFSFFFLAEYANMFVVSAIAVTFFLGGWLPPFADIPSAVYAGVGGLVAAGVGYGIKKRGFDAFIGLTIGSGIGVLVGVIQARHAGIHDSFLFSAGVFRFVEGGFWFTSKIFALLFVMIWLRWTLPRYRVDQLMDLCWKKLTPLAFMNLLAIGFLAKMPQWWDGVPHWWARLMVLFGWGAR
jgi:NADH-quinone oxidoreductase subunit H